MPAKVAQVHAEKRIGKSLVFHQRGDDGGGHGGRVPALGSECGRGNDFALGFDLGGGLHRPAFVQFKLALGRVRRGNRSAGLGLGFGLREKG